MIKAVFRTALRALQGFVRSLIEGPGLDIRSDDQTGCTESDDRTRDAKKLQGGQLNQAAIRQLCCLEGIAQQSLFFA